MLPNKAWVAMIRDKTGDRLRGKVTQTCEALLRLIRER